MRGRDLQLGARRHGLITGSLELADMQERIAGPVAELDETKAFVALEPFHSRVDCRGIYATEVRGRERRAAAEL